MYSHVQTGHWALSKPEKINPVHASGVKPIGLKIRIGTTNAERNTRAQAKVIDVLITLRPGARMRRARMKYGCTGKTILAVRSFYLSYIVVVVPLDKSQYKILLVYLCVPTCHFVHTWYLSEIAGRSTIFEFLIMYSNQTTIAMKIELLL